MSKTAIKPSLRASVSSCASFMGRGVLMCKRYARIINGEGFFMIDEEKSGGIILRFDTALKSLEIFFEILFLSFCWVTVLRKFFSMSVKAMQFLHDHIFSDRGR